jgi:hypothetical protein
MIKQKLPMLETDRNVGAGRFFSVGPRQTRLCDLAICGLRIAPIAYQRPQAKRPPQSAASSVTLCNQKQGRHQHR